MATPENDLPVERHDLAFEAFLEASNNVIRRAKETGTPVVVWENGQVKEIPPQDLLPNITWQRLADEHRRWLSQFPETHARNWERLLKQDWEAAIAEAGIRRLFEKRGVEVRPNDELGSGRASADFICRAGNVVFVAEAKCIRVDTATDASNVSPNCNVAHFYKLPATEVFEACNTKARQLANRECPTLLAITTLHDGVANPGVMRNTLRRSLMGASARCLKGAVFAQRDGDDDSQPPEFVRNEISAILFCNIVQDRPYAVGAVNPQPLHPFPISVLPDIEFASLTFDDDQRIKDVQWTSSNGVHDGESD